MTQPEQLAPVLSYSWAEMLAYGSTALAIYNEDFMKSAVQNGEYPDKAGNAGNTWTRW